MTRIYRIPAKTIRGTRSRSKKPDGPRYDPDYPAEKLDLFDNLILLCPTHHGPVVDAEKGRAFIAEDLEKMRDDHVANFDRLEALEGTLNAYLGEQLGADDKILFEQAQLRGPTVESMFVDVPFTCRSDAKVAEVLRGIADKHPGDFEVSARTDGQPVTGAAQALLSPEWNGNALLVGGPGQGKSTLLQYICQFHRSRLLNKTGYAGDGESLDVSDAQARSPSASICVSTQNGRDVKQRARVAGRTKVVADGDVADQTSEVAAPKPQRKSRGARLRSF
jgi:hypothetical protein